MFDWGSKIRHCVYPFLPWVLSAGKVTRCQKSGKHLPYLFEPKGSLPKPLPNPKLEEKLKPGKLLANGSLGLIRPWLRFRLPGFQKKGWNWISYVSSIKHASYERIIFYAVPHCHNEMQTNTTVFISNMVWWTFKPHISCSWLTKKHGLLFKHHFLLYCSCEKCKLQAWWPISFRGLLYPGNMISAQFCNCK